MVIVGLTGLIGSGKSTVADLFATLGVPIIDTDLIAHELTKPGSLGLELLVAQFGRHILNGDGFLRRDYLRELVFSNQEHLSSLETIIHPLILKEVKLRLQLVATASYILLVVPLLFKSPNYLKLTTRSLFVDCAYPLLVKRLASRSSLTKSAVDAILARQVSRETQLELADDVIVNNGDYAGLEAQVITLHRSYMLLSE